MRALLLAAALSGATGGAIGAQPPAPVILISVDTLRADHLSCYRAEARVKTPHIDALARGGTLYSEVSTPVPLTLPAHTALLSSTGPGENGVVDNGVAFGGALPTLATEFKGAGYRTAAFVASFVLDRRFGLSRGFDTYEGPVEPALDAAGVVMERKRSGAQVAEAAERWVERNSGGPFFLFLHLYDLHLPYDLPRQASLRHGETGYGAELAYEDGVVGGFLDYLRKRGLYDKALIVFTSDHGEGLGDHGESTHGFFLYQSTVHVPLIVHWPAGGKSAGRARVDDPASLLDVAPTALEAVGLKPAATMRGRSLLASGGAEEVYSESLYAQRHFGCAPLRSLRMGPMKYIGAPKPEMYDLAADPGETRNLYGERRSQAAGLEGRLRAREKSAGAGKPAAKQENVAALRSLGYLGGPAKGQGADPKDRIADFEKYYRALDLMSAGRTAEAVPMLEALAAKLPGIGDIRVSLGLGLLRRGDYAAAAGAFERAVGLDASDAQAHYELGFCRFRMGQLDGAEAELKRALALEPWNTRADEALAQIYLQKRDPPRAREYLERLLATDPNSYTANFNLGIFAAMERNWDEAERRLAVAVRVNPGSAEAHETLGKVEAERGDLEAARKQLAEAVRLRPDSGQAHFELGMVLQKLGRMDEAEKEMQKAKDSPGSGQPPGL